MCYLTMIVMLIEGDVKVTSYLTMIVMLIEGDVLPDNDCDVD